MYVGPLRLGVNIDHVATVRNARGGNVPDPIRAAKIAEEAGAKAGKAAGKTVGAEAGREAGVDVTERVESGDVVSTIHMVASEVSAGLIIMGASNGRVVGRWTSSNVLDTSTRPVLVIPHAIGEP